MERKNWEKSDKIYTLSYWIQNHCDRNKNEMLSKQFVSHLNVESPANDENLILFLSWFWLPHSHYITWTNVLRCFVFFLLCATTLIQLNAFDKNETRATPPNSEQFCIFTSILWRFCLQSTADAHVYFLFFFFLSFLPLKRWIKYLFRISHYCRQLILISNSFNAMRFCNFCHLQWYFEFIVYIIWSVINFLFLYL